MDAKDILSEKEKMESNIAGYIHKEISNFYEKTGLSPDTISVDIIDVSTVNEKRTVTGDVSVKYKF